jgi:zinc and cadmium transporter
VIFLFINDEKLKLWMPRFIALATGVLLADAFLHLLPDAMEIAQEGNNSVFLWTLIGILAFFFIETALQRLETHYAKYPVQKYSPIESFAKMNLIGDGIHNFVDGILIASSFLVDPALGVATTIAIVLHEIPQEISDIAILIQGGYPKRRAITLNFLCALFCVAGAMSTLALFNVMELSLSNMLALTAGGFIYIAASDLFPLLRSEALRDKLPSQAIAIVLGVISMQLILWVEAISRA